METELLYSECRSEDEARSTVTEETPYRELANAVVMQAAQDYYAALRKCRRCNTEQNRKEVRALEAFFRGEWYSQLTDANGEALLRRIRAVALKGYMPQRARA